MKPKEKKPVGFSGLTYAPSCEEALYLLLGLLSPYLPYSFMFEKFAINSSSQENEYERRPGIKGQFLTDNQWEKAKFEFKLLSSSFSREPKGQDESEAIFLICWINDSRRDPNRIEKVISLREVFEKRVPNQFRERIILYPNRIAKLSKLIDEEHIDTFSAANSIKVQRLLLKWPYHQRSGVLHLHNGHLEILLTLDGTGEASIRACIYEKGEYLGVDKNIFHNIRSEFDTSKFRTEETGKRLNIWLDEMRVEDVDRLAVLVAEDIVSNITKRL